MARIAGIDIPKDKRIVKALTYIFGIGDPTAERICAECKIDPSARVNAMPDADIQKIRKWLDAHQAEVPVEGDRKRDVSLDIKRLTEIGCYRGVRHRKGLPVRGQSTKQNARTRKGPKKMVTRTKKG